MRRPRSPQDREQPFVAHLVELRNRMLRTVAVISVIFLALFPFASELYAMLAKPMLSHMPAGGTMIATEVASPFLAPFKFTMFLAFFIAIPFVLYQLWAFVAPGLYKNERRLVFPLLVSSTLLFYLGVVFAYYVVFPLVFGFMVGTAPEGVAVMTDITKYLDFVIKMFFAFGLAFEVPVATVLLVKGDITTAASLTAKRPYIIIGAFVVGMLLTPPDVISQTLLAVPIWLLFELGIIASRYVSAMEQEAGDDNVKDKVHAETKD